jgi:hypothetical protein
MNRRIHELFDQTLEQFNEEHKDAPYRAMFIVPDPVKEKFAESIVRECIQVMYDNAIERQVPPDIEKTPTHYAVAILEHFRIQETKREKFDRAIKETFGFGADLSGKETP